MTKAEDIVKDEEYQYGFHDADCKIKLNTLEK